ncbi:SPOC like C-terminal domain-containing protein [Lentinula edodes]|uniref:SPOC like C-terminal domain-containing protein n=1 Tax=Lentinula edodes TaxID=5353 RepID=UPI001E8DF24C|nr:SPOC like C-terminal domain-containing protein [Lentinula edodes]KAH7869395.1 SPOC like C-terminal domain-containing protein [Lentinula edodes]
MTPYDDWNRVDEDEEDERQDVAFFDANKDLMLLCIDYETKMTSHLYAALNSAINLQKRKVVTGPSDSFGVLLFNTTRNPDTPRTQGSEIKKNMFLYQPIGPISVPTIQELIQLLNETIPPCDSRVAMGDVFTSCNWVIRDGAPKTVTKRVFLITDEDDPHPSSKQLKISAQMTLEFYSSVLQTNAFTDDLDSDPSILNQSISISTIEDLLSQIFRQYSDYCRNYGLVTEQKKGEYKYFVDLGDRLEATTVKTGQLDPTKIRNSKSINPMAVVGAAPSNDNDAKDDSMAATEVIKSGQRPFYTADEMRSFRTFGLKPGLKLLGFKPRDTINALLKSMIKKKVVGLAREVLRRNPTPTIYAVLPQEEDVDEMEPAGFHIIRLPFADDIRSAPVDEGYIASDELKDKARAWINKTTIKSGYVPDSYPNPVHREEFNPDAFEDLTEPNVDLIHAKAGKLLKEWKVELANDHSATLVVPVTGSKRKSEDTSNDGIDVAEIKTRFETGSLMKAFCRSQNLSTSGKKPI